MNKIASFTIDHLKLQPGVYAVSYTHLDVYKRQKLWLVQLLAKILQ